MGDEVRGFFFIPDKFIKLIHTTFHLGRKIFPGCRYYMIKIKTVQRVRATPHNDLFHHAQLAPKVSRTTNIDKFI
jgi:hypothetical protein